MSTAREPKDIRGMWVHLFPAPDIAGQWLADGIEVGWMTDGRNRLDAVSRFIEGMQVMEMENRAAGKDIMGLRPAPLEEWPECMRRADQLTRLHSLSRNDLTRAPRAEGYVLLLAVPIPKDHIISAKGAALDWFLSRSYLVAG